MDEDVCVDGGYSIYTDLSHDGDVFYLYICHNIFISLLSLDVEGIKSSLDFVVQY